MLIVGLGLFVQAQSLTPSSTLDTTGIKGYSVNGLKSHSLDSLKKSFNKKAPGTAFFLSLVIVGGGQFYNGQVGKGFIMMGSMITGGILFFSAIENQTFTSGTRASIGFGIMVGTVLWSLIDAPITAVNLNKKNSMSINLSPSIHSYQNGNLALGPRLILEF